MKEEMIKKIFDNAIVTNGVLKEYHFNRIPTCVYLLLQDDEVVYVGKTVDLPTRVSNHLKGNAATPKKEFNRVFYIPYTENVLNEAELSLMQAFKPKYNTVIAKNGPRPPKFGTYARYDQRVQKRKRIDAFLGAATERRNKKYREGLNRKGPKHDPYNLLPDLK